MQQEKQDPYKKGDIVTWKLWNEMIIKAEIGERREHFVTHNERVEREFYRPESEHYLGQFPIDYEPTKFPRLTKEEALALPLTPILPAQALEFNLMLNGSWVQATDRSVVSDETLDHPDQVKVIVNNYSLGGNTKQSFEDYTMLELDADSAETNNGMTCYRFKDGSSGQRCFGYSLKDAVSGFSFYVSSDVNYRIQVYTHESMYGGVEVKWYIDQKNISRAQEIDAAIWRLLDVWNISPIK